MEKSSVMMSMNMNWMADHDTNGANVALNGTNVAFFHSFTTPTALGDLKYQGYTLIHVLFLL